MSKMLPGLGFQASQLELSFGDLLEPKVEGE